MDQPAVLPQYASGFIDDRTAGIGIGPQFLDQRRIIAVGDEADILAVGFARYAEAEFRRQFAHARLGQAAERKAQIIELRLRRREQEIALVARRIGSAVQLSPARPHHPADIMAGRQAIRAEIARGGEQIGEFRPHVALNARDRGATRQIFVGEAIDHRFAEARFMVEHIMRDAQPIAHRARIANVAAGAARPCTTDRFAVIVELQRDADRLCSGARGECGHHRRIDPARHRHDDPLAREIRSQLKVHIIHRRADRRSRQRMQNGGDAKNCASFTRPLGPWRYTVGSHPNRKRLWT